MATNAEDDNSDWLDPSRSDIMVIGRPSGPLTDVRIIMAERV